MKIGVFLPRFDTPSLTVLPPYRYQQCIDSNPGSSPQSTSTNSNRFEAWIRVFFLFRQINQQLRKISLRILSSFGHHKRMSIVNDNRGTRFKIFTSVTGSFK
jgi:hypothetical protein